MLRGPRLDAPGVLYHVMAHGMERQGIFRADADRRDFVQRLARWVETHGVTIYEMARRDRKEATYWQQLGAALKP